MEGTTMDWDELRTNKEKFPDDTTVEIGGEKLTLGEYRKKMGPVSEFTKHTQKLSEENKQAIQAYQQSQAQLAQAQAMLKQAEQARQMAAQQPAPDLLNPLTPYRTDPAFSPLVAYYDREIDQLKQIVKEQAGYLQQSTTAMNAYRYGTEMEKLKETDKDLDTQKLAAYTTDLYTRGPDVRAAHRLMTYDDTIKRLEKDAEQRGYERAKAEPPAPPTPGGRRGGGRPSGEKPLPTDLNGRVSLAVQDADLMRGLEQGLNELANG